MMWFQVFKGDELVASLLRRLQSPDENECLLWGYSIGLVVELKRARLNDELRGKDLLVTGETWWQSDDEVDLNWKAANIE